MKTSKGEWRLISFNYFIIFDFLSLVFGKLFSLRNNWVCFAFAGHFAGQTKPNYNLPPFNLSERSFNKKIYALNVRIDYAWFTNWILSNVIRVYQQVLLRRFKNKFSQKKFWKNTSILKTNLKNFFFYFYQVTKYWALLLQQRVLLFTVTVRINFDFSLKQ